MKVWRLAGIILIIIYILHLALVEPNHYDDLWYYNLMIVLDFVLIFVWSINILLYD